MTSYETQAVIERELNQAYPVSEVFTSVQGSGQYVGRNMTFIRLAGCCIGKQYTEGARAALTLSPWQDRCTDVFGHAFSCDVNYHKKRMMAVGEMLLLPEIVSRQRICITGGEPLMYDLQPMINTLRSANKRISVETSGTIYQHFEEDVWVTVSPKDGCLDNMLDRANEILVLISESFKKIPFLGHFGKYFNKVWIQPVNFERSLNHDNVVRCLNLQNEFPQLNLSLQIQKVIGVR